MKRFTVLGDSISSLSLGYSPYLKSRLERFYTFAPHEENCGDSRGLLAAAKAEVQTGASDMYLVNAGLHDVKTDPSTGEKQVGDAEYAENLRAALSLLKGTGADVAFCTTTDAVDRLHNARQTAFRRYLRDVSRANELARGVCRELDVPVIELGAFTRGLGEGAFRDHVHHTDEARNAQAAFLADALVALFVRNRVYDTVLIGATALAAGFAAREAAKGRRCAIVEAGYLAAPEFSESWSSDGGEASCACGEAGEGLRAELADRSALSWPPALAPIMSGRLLAADAECLYGARVTAISACGEDYRLTARALGEPFALRARRIVDTTSDFDTRAFFGEPEPARAEASIAALLEDGRFVRVPAPGAKTASEARDLALSAWTGGRIVRLAGEISAPPVETERRLSQACIWAPSEAYGNAVRAFDTGAALADELPAREDETCALTRPRVIDEGEYDVIVAGLGTAGAPCALEAARRGLRVLGVEQLGVMGGTGTAGAVMSYYYGVRGGSYTETDERAEALAREHMVPCACGGDVTKTAVYRRTARERNVDARLRALATDALTENGRVVGLRFADASGLHEARAKYVIDATADGAIARMAGCATLPARATDGAVMPYSNVVLRWDGERVYWTYRDCGIVNQYDAFALGREVTRSSCDDMHLLADYAAAPRYLGTAALIGLREGERIVGTETLTIDDAFLGRETDRPAFFARTNLDHHAKDFALEDAWVRDWFVIAAMWGYNLTLAVPVGAMIPRDTDGLLVAGRGLSVDHSVGLGVRMKDDAAKSGDAAAVLADLSIRLGVPARSVPYEAVARELRGTGCLERPAGAPVSRQHGGDTNPDAAWLADLAAIREGLSSDRPGYAMWSARRMGGCARASLARWLEEGDATLRANAALALALLDDARGEDALLSLIGDPFVPDTSYLYTPPRGLSAVAALGRLRSLRATEPLLAIVRGETPTAFRADSYIFDESDLAFQYLSHAVVALLAIAKAHPERADEIKTALRARLYAPDFEARVSMMGATEPRPDMANALRALLEAAK